MQDILFGLYGDKYTINQARRDSRIDYALFDIKKLFHIIKKDVSKLEKYEDRIDTFKKENLRMKCAYANDNTFFWLSSFNSFNDFIKKMKLERWCVKLGNDYEIINLEKSVEELKAVKDKKRIYEEYVKKDYHNKVTKQYLENLKEIVNEKFKPIEK